MRVELYAVEGSPNVWATDDDGELYDTGTPVERVATAWSDPAWDLRLT